MCSSIGYHHQIVAHAFQTCFFLGLSTWKPIRLGLHYRFGHVLSMYRSSPFRSTVNTGYITGLDMCRVCTEAVHSVAL